MSGDEDDSPTVVLDLKALKMQKLKQEEDLANIVQDLEFAVGINEDVSSPAPQAISRQLKDKKSNFPIVLFDFQSDFFEKAKDQFPKGYDYLLAKTLPELNKFLSSKKFQIVIFNYDVNPKAVNQLTSQIKLKFPESKTIIMAKSLAPDKVKAHARTPAGASGYYQLPLDAEKIESEFLKIEMIIKKLG